MSAGASGPRPKISERHLDHATLAALLAPVSPIGDRRARRRSGVLAAGQRAQHLVIGAILHHEHDEVLDLAAETRDRER
jgi:hypothetical protein